MLGMDVDINSNCNTKTIDLRDVMDVSYYLYDLRHHDDLFDYFLDDSIVGLEIDVALSELLDDSFSWNLNQLCLRWNTYSNFSLDLLDNFLGNESFYLFLDLCKFLAVDLDRNRYLFYKLNWFVLFDNVSMNQSLSCGNSNWNLFIVDQVDKFGDLH